MTLWMTADDGKCMICCTFGVTLVIVAGNGGEWVDKQRDMASQNIHINKCAYENGRGKVQPTRDPANANIMRLTGLNISAY